MKVLLLLFIFSFQLFAQLTFQPTYNLSNTPSATSDYHSTYSYEQHYYVVWGDNGAIKYKYSSNFGTTWTPNITISSTENVCGWPVVTAEYNRVYVAYHELASDYQIIFQSSSDFGQTWTPMKSISGNATGAITPQIVFFLNTLFVVFEQKVNNISEIYLTRSTDNGLTWSTFRNLSNSPTLQSRWVQLQNDGNIFYCAWIEQSTYPLGDIYFCKSVDRGLTWQIPENITNDSRPQNRFFMRSNYSGNVYIMTDDIITFNFDEIYFFKSTNEGLTWSTPVNITNNPGNSNTPSFEVMGNYIYFTWSDNTLSAPAYDNSDIMFKWSSDGGVTWRDSTNLSVNPETSSRPRICYGWNGPLGAPWLEISVIWYDYSTGNAEILARRGFHYLYDPVELNSFTASEVDDNIMINWTTSTEKNNKGFELFRKPVNGNWKNIYFMKGNGTSLEPHSYSYTDKNISSGKYIYRLDQIDLDGTRNELKEIEVEINPPLQFTLQQNYPNPFNPSTKINFTIPGNEFVTLRVYDILGNVVNELVNEEKTAGKYSIDFNAGILSSGVYIYKINAGSFTASRQMLFIK